MRNPLHMHEALLIAPASKPRDMLLLEDTLHAINESGLPTRRMRPSLDEYGYLAGKDALRSKEFNDALADSKSDLLLCARGGYGSLRILADIDYKLASKNPKTLIGYSDITALQLALWEKSSWKSISGPMPGVDWPAPGTPTMDRLSQLFLSDKPFELIGPNDEKLLPLNSGSSEGILLGGNLSLITKLIGTEFLPDLSGSILFIEEVGEAPYQVDGHLAQLELSGKLEQIGGLVCGQFTDWSPTPGKPSLSYEEVIEHYAKKHDIPTAFNLQYGHIPIKNSMPIGVRAKLHVDDRSASLTILESIKN